ncbi:Disks large-associated protein 5 [Collichthys lucidus]|uniref:Disks large-associated protein 5 n=1 Tax=Collichthys lucidus TaxID=240159 RepID=A0A4U5VNH5_COLLU|nr:Disks large-associated protein 5 [Collichthys lucidus]
MDSRFAHLRQRDTSVSMLRVKMSRRRSQSQKENRERAVNTRRQLDKLPELEMSSLDASIAMANMSIIHEKTTNNAKLAKNEAIEERLKQLQRWKERKALEKEKEKREKERKGVFKTGVYHPKDGLVVVSLPAVPSASTRAKETNVNTASSQSTRVTRSMKQQQVEKPLKMQNPNAAAKKAQPAVERSTRSRVAPDKPAAAAPAKTKVCPVEPVLRALSTRSANRPPVTAAPAVKEKPKDKPAGVRTTRSRAFVNTVAPPSDEEKNRKAQPAVAKESELKEPEEKARPSSPTPCSEEEEMVVDQACADSVPVTDLVEAPSSPSSFAPAGFTFQAPTGLSSFKFEPLTPRSADAFLTPSPTFSLPPVPLFNAEPQTEPSKPSPPESPHRSPPRTSPAVAPPAPGSPVEPKHDVPYFRSEITNETERLLTLCDLWEPKVEDEFIPEEMRDSMRTAVGQARLLMKERFKQFSGLVDDCELGRGEKITTCTDLQGFWDMVYYQVEDVNKKFNALKEAESRGWVDEQKPPPRQKKVVKKPSAAPTKPTGTKAAARSRLASVKAAMKARQQAAEAEKAANDAGNDEENAVSSSQEPQPQAEAQPANTVVFDGGFFQVESPAKPPGSLRRSSRLSAAVLPQASPYSNYLSPRRVTRRSLALAQTPLHTAAAASPAQPVLTPAQLRLTLSQTPAQASKSQRGTPQSTQNKKDTAPEPSSSLSFTLSPCMTPTLPPISPPPAVQRIMETQESVCHTPHSSVVEEIPGLDFERYLQPTLRCSLSPRETVAVETFSPMAVDIGMESPRGQTGDLLTQQEPVTTALPAVSSLLTLQSPQTQTAESALLLFTPDMKERIRQSVCPSDLMVFTPPL